MIKPQMLMTGLVFPESPRWHADRLWFSDWGAHEIIAVARDGTSEVITRMQSFPFCFDFLSDGRLRVVSDHLLLRREPDGSLVTHANLTGLSAYPWNEIVVDGRGNVYVNNVGFDFPGGAFAPGIIALVTPDGAVRQVAEGVAFPNGMAVTPDNATLIVAESYANRLTAFDIAVDGGLSNRRIWADTGNDHPDGICLDSDGAVWYADVGSKHCVRVRERGAVLQTIELDRGCFACMLGGTDRMTLFMVANEWKGTVENMTNGTRTGQVLTVEASVPGVGWP